MIPFTIKQSKSKIVALLLVIAFQSATAMDTEFESACTKLADSAEPDAAKLAALFKLDWDYELKEHPEMATYTGQGGPQDRWTDESLEAIERRKRELQAPLKVLAAIHRDKLGTADRLNYDLFERNLRQSIEGTRFKEDYLAISQLSGVQQDVPEMLAMMPHSTVADYETVIRRLGRVPAVVGQEMALLQKGLESGVTPPRITLRDVPKQVEDVAVKDPAKNPMLRAFNEMPPTIPAGERERLEHEAAKTLTDTVLPAFDKLHEFLVTKYVPGARESIACSDLPDGKAWYAFNARQSTTTTMTPEQIHQLGLSEVKRIRVEMDKVIAETGFKGSFEKFGTYLRTDPKFYFTDADSLLRAYRDIAKRIDPELIKLFGKLPRLPYGVIPVPAYMEKSQTTAYYQPGSLKAGRPGYFYANTYDLKTRPKWEMEPLTMHEAVPGHHLQISLAQELDEMPEFRKHSGYTAFVEGWGLYAESLGDEIGFYKDPYAKYGRLTYEMWRAVRLVVDTGMHTMGWSRQQAIDYFKSNTSKTDHDIVVEIDRYIVWPGQALAYKIGELKIKELRAYAKQELGDKFDIRDFHDQLLGNGALPLDVLEKRMKEWVAAKKAGNTAVP
jgi:uncharacterized protein (DUF885 family)